MKKFIQKKGNEILSLPEKYQSDDELVSIMKQRVSELQEEQCFCQTKVEARDLLSQKFNDRA